MKNLKDNKKILISVLSLVVGIVLVMLPMFMGDYVIHIMNQIGIIIILVSSLNLIVGYTGQLSFAHVGLFAVGAYTSAVLTTTYGLSFWMALPLGALAAAVVGFLIGLPSLRFQTHFFAIVTLAFAEIIRLGIYNGGNLTGGPNGIYSIPFPNNILGLDFTQRGDFYYIILIAAAVTVLSIYLITRSRIGREMIAIRENETFAKFIGIDTWKVKIISFTISAFFAGFAGGLYAHYNSFISPFSFEVSESVTYLLMVIIGGMGTILGPILGAVFLLVLPELLRSINDYRMIIYGAMLILTIMFLPGGFVGLYRNLKSRLLDKKSVTKPLKIKPEIRKFEEEN